jgi:membrane fusion protein
VDGEVTRKARLPGLLVPVLGSLQLAAPQAGVLAELRVAEGDALSAGQPLIVVDLDRDAGHGRTGALVAQTLHARRTTLEIELRLVQQQGRQRHAALAERLRSLEAERHHAEAELDAALRRVSLVDRRVERFRLLVHEGFVSESQLQDRQEEWLDATSRERTARRVIAALSRDADAARAEQAANAAQAQAQQAQFERALVLLDAEARENDARRRIVVAAPRAGVVSALTVSAGQAVTPGQAMAAIVPCGPDGASTLEAHLYAASRAAGFVRPGQRVWLRFDAYPHQKFGMAEGEITHISRTPIAPQDLPSGQAQTHEPLYRVTVKLARQSIDTYGRSQLLKPGMTLQADVLQDRRAVWEWILEPVIAASGIARNLGAKPNKADPGG